MSTSLFDFIRGLMEEELLPEMRPDRIGGGRLLGAKFEVELDGQNGSSGTANGCLGSSATETSSVTGGLSRKLTTAEMKRFLRWMADSLDTDTPNLDIEVTSDKGSTATVQNVARRISEKASA